MPTIARIGKIVIRMFADDHNPPHFHVVTPDHAATVTISDLSILAGEMDRRSLETALAWAAGNRRMLEHEWERLNQR